MDSTHQLSDTERNIIARSKASGDFQIDDFKVTRILNVDAYLGEYYRIEMTISDGGQQPKSTIHRFFMKTLPSHGGWQVELMRQNRLFEKESSFYEKISAVFRNIISTEIHPECFLVAPGKIVLEDLSALGYRPFHDQRLPLDLHHAKQGILVLARFHSASLIYEEQTGRKMSDDFPDSTREANFKAGTRGFDFLSCGAKAIASLAPHVEKYQSDPEAVSRIQSEVVPIMIKLEEYLREDVSFRQSLCHGDSWPANFLFKYDNDGKAVSAMLIDFQLTRYRPPVSELLIFLYVSLTMSDLKNWRETLLDLYYETFAQEIANAGLNVDSVYSKDEFRQTYIYYQIMGVIYALLFFPFSRIGKDRMAAVCSDRETGLRFQYEDRGDHLIESYKVVPLMKGFMDAAMEEMYENFIKTKRGHTEFTPKEN